MFKQIINYEHIKIQKWFVTYVKLLTLQIKRKTNYVNIYNTNCNKLSGDGLKEIPFFMPIYIFDAITGRNLNTYETVIFYEKKNKSKVSLRYVKRCLRYV